ncbi:MAG: aldehyde dehydrogenase (NADP(+)) [Pirellulales bacterium]|nr:aldehyde dehydrogenase (NADP(+)) [Pirellulales bacterium]
MTQLHGHNFLAGGLQGSEKTFTAVSPCDGSQLAGAFAMASTADVDAALTAAAAASGPFAATSGEQRAVFLERIAEEIEALGDALLERAHQETALPLARLTGERGRTVGQLRLFASMARDASWTDPRIDRAMPDRQPLPRPDLRRAKRPVGPVVVFGSSNFPLAFSVAGGDTASALCTGNPVVVKAHRAHPGTSELVASAIAKAVEACGMPAGTFSMLHGQGSVIGLALVKHPATQAVGFTGSRAAGRALCDAAAGRPDPIPVFAEMSSINPVFLLPGAVAERAETIAQGFVASMTLGVGQFCTKPGLVFAVEGSELEAFRQAVAKAVTAAPAASMLTADIRDSFAAGRDTLVGLDGTATLATAEATADTGKTEATAVVAQTDLATFLADPRYAEEVFGPASLLVTAGSVDELAKAADALEGQLTATLHGTEGDLAAAGSLVEILATKAGRLIVNGFPTGVEVCHAMQHGGPWPATSDSRFTSVGSAALERFIRPVCYQDLPEALLPDALKDANPLGLERLVNGVRGQH